MKRISIGSWAYSIGPYQDCPVPWTDVLTGLKKLNFDGVEVGDGTWVGPDCSLGEPNMGFYLRRDRWEAPRTAIGARSILSRAVAGTVDRAVVIALPGSTAAVRLAVTKIIAPMLPHAVALLR